MINDFTLINGDCLEELPKLIDEGVKVDLVLTDLPYGTTRNKWDSIIDLDKLWSNYNQIIKENGAVVLFAQPPFDKVLACSNLENFRYEWIWKKDNSTGFLNCNRMPLKIHENILVFYKKLPTYNPQFTQGKPYIRKMGKKQSTNYGKYDRVTTRSNGKRYPIDVLKFNMEIGLHPTQKPVNLLEYFIRTYSNPGEIILDTCMGSGSTGVACCNTNRKFIGIELDKNYYGIAEKRIKEAYSQKRLM